MHLISSYLFFPAHGKASAGNNYLLEDALEKLEPVRVINKKTIQLSLTLYQNLIKLTLGQGKFIGGTSVNVGHLITRKRVFVCSLEISFNF